MARVGQLDQRINFNRYTEVDDGQGGQDLTKSQLGEVWASVAAATGNEKEDFEQVNSTHKYKFIVRYRTDILASDRIEWQGVEYNIRSISDEGARSLYLELDAERGVGQ